MNLDGTVAEDGRTVDLDAGRLSSRRRWRGTSSHRQLRPQHLEPHDDGMPLTVRVCEPLGEETDVVLETADQTTVTARLHLTEVPDSGAMTLRPAPDRPISSMRRPASGSTDRGLGLLEDRVGADDLAIVAAVLDGAAEGLVVDVHQPNRFEAAPLEVVQDRPVEVAADVGAVLDRERSCSDTGR